MSDENKYSVKLTYSIGVARGSMSWDVSKPLDGELLDELIEALKDELGTTKEIFVSNLTVSVNSQSAFNLSDLGVDLNLEI